MPGSEEHSPGEDYFNDLSQQPSNNADERRGSQDEDTANGQVPKPKRIACVLCRKRKLKCDGNKPACGTCVRLQHDCSYDEVRRKSGPKRGYVKALEARLAQVETLLKTQDDPPTKKKDASAKQQQQQQTKGGMVPEFDNIALGSSNMNLMSHTEHTINRVDAPQQTQYPHTMLGTNGNSELPAEEAFPWEMIGLGLDEPLPTQDVVNELDQIYFEKVHPSLPMMHRPRYHAAMNLAPHMRPPVCLRYAMWCNAAAVSDKYEQLQEHFYHRARKYIQQDEMKGHGESMITVAHCQTWVLLATYEFKLMYFPRAWMSAGRACRMAQMMGLHRLDGSGLDVKQCLPPPKDWTEREERRRTFWMTFCVDRYSSIGTGWPMTIDEKDIHTTLPSDEESYELSRPTKTTTLEASLNPDGLPSLSGYGGVILMACMFGRNLTHLHRPSEEDADDDLNGEFWKRHRNMDNILLNTSLALPDQLRLPSGMNDANVVFLNMCIHTSTICLHQAAIFKADKNKMPARVSAESKVRCITAAAEVASIMRQICHLDLSSMNPFISFCLYVGARVFVQYLKSRPKDEQVKSSLQFLLCAMQAIKRKNPLTESFLVQLDVDLEGAGLEDPRSFKSATMNKSPAEMTRSEGCVFTLGAGQGGKSIYEGAGIGPGNPLPDVPTVPSSKPAPTGPAKHSTFGSYSVSGLNNDESMAFFTNPGQFDLPVRSPASHPGSGAHRSPQSYNMDTTPEGSGAAENHTPNSSNQSQQNISAQSSNTGYSPGHMQNQYQPTTGLDPGRMTGPDLFAPNGNSFSTDFDMQNFPVSTAENQQGFVLPSDWGVGGTGFTPGPTGMTPGMSGANDMLSMSDADWNQMMESINFQPGWDSGVEHLETHGNPFTQAQSRHM